MYSFPDMGPDCCSMSNSDCCFLNCIQIYMKPHMLQSMGSQRVEHNWAGQVIWYSYLFKNFPQFVVIYTVKGFSIVNEPKKIFLWNSCFFDESADVENLITCSSVFCKFSLNIWKFMVHVLLEPGLENFEHCFPSMWDECNREVVLTFFCIAFL